MHIAKDIIMGDLALIINKNLIIADTHIGYEEALNKQGILIPRFQFKELIKRLENIINSKKFNKIIINGDIKHEFGAISEQEWSCTLKLLDFLSKHCNEIILIKGNHDTILGPIAKKRNVKVVNHFVLGNILVIHGHKLEHIGRRIKTIIIAHEHPAVSLREGAKIELFKCYLKGKWKKHNLIVQPSLNLVTEGTDVMKEELLSPFLHQDISNFECFIVGEDIYNFGKLRNLK